MFTVDIEGKMVTVCMLGSYSAAGSGAEMIILVVVNQDDMLHISAEDLERLVADDKVYH